MLYGGAPTGVIVAGVSDNSPANAAGLQRGDVIVKLNGVPIDSTRQLARVASQDTSFWDLIIERGGQQFTFSSAARRCRGVAV